MGRPAWRSLNSVMVLTLHVAMVAAVFRAIGRPATLAGSLGVWVPLTISVAVYLSWPLGRAIVAAIRDDRASSSSRCLGCGHFELRPLLRPGRGLFQPVAGYRCAFCGTTHRPVDGRVVVERPASDIGAPGPAGIVFLAEATGPEVCEEIRFLDDDPPAPANFRPGPVSRLPE